jgi:hypothetical protein
MPAVGSLDLSPEKPKKVTPLAYCHNTISLAATTNHVAAAAGTA